MHPRPSIRPTLKIDSENELFIAICKWPVTVASMCKQPMSVHTAVTVGIRDKNSQQNHILCATGKYIDYDRVNSPSHFLIFDALYSNVPTKLKEEYLMFANEDLPICYKAFTISQNQYDHFLKQLSHCKRSGRLGAYQKLATDENSSEIYEYRLLENNDNDAEVRINRSVQTLNINNTCRHTAKELLACGTGKGYKAEDIPSFFLANLPNKAHINAGKINADLFIFPLPPSKENLDKNLYLLLSKIYRRLENISKSYITHTLTHKKFQALKELYVKLDARNATDSIFNSLTIIEDWEKNNKNTIDAKRGFSLFKTTATHELVTDLKSTLQKVRKRM